MAPKVNIGGRVIGEGEPCFIVAEAGVNHNGSLKIAKKLIDAAKDAGADAVKFQTFKAESLATKFAEKAEYQKKTDPKDSQYRMLKKLELPYNDFENIAEYAEKKKIIFLSSPFDEESADFLDKIGVPAFKIASGEITNFPLLSYIARKAKPLLLSTGMSTLEEIREAVDILRNNGLKDIVLLHCVTSYPAKIKDMNLRAMETLKNVFNIPAGLSDHTLGITIPVAAVALGAAVIEKHFTLDKTLPGPDHRASLDSKELNEMVNAIRDVEKSMGDGIKKLTKEEEEIKKLVRKSIVARVDIPQGSDITEDMLDLKRPATGISPKYLSAVINKRAKIHIRKDMPLTWEMLE